MAAPEPEREVKKPEERRRVNEVIAVRRQWQTN